MGSNATGGSWSMGGAASAGGAGDTGEPVTGGAKAASDAGQRRIPINHRPAGSTCPQERGAGSVRLDRCALDGGYVDCVRDSDCTMGTNGRCFSDRFPCMTSCRYDTCFGDSDCPNNQPCECRGSPLDSESNSCVTGGNCRIDADCGSDGFCSPSQVNGLCGCMSSSFCPDGSGSCSVYGPNGWTTVPCACGDSCGHGYFCHTPQDTCIDDSDCNGGDTCDYDLPSKAWRCTWCLPPP